MCFHLMDVHNQHSQSTNATKKRNMSKMPIVYYNIKQSTLHVRVYYIHINGKQNEFNYYKNDIAYKKTW